MGLKDTIFKRFWSLFDRTQDANKDADGKGTLERYNEVVGDDYDQNVAPFIDNAADNLVVPTTMLDRFVIDRENSLGNTQLFLGADFTMRKRIIKHFITYVSVKGTRRGYGGLFGTLGIIMTLNELFVYFNFDSPTTLDSSIRPVFDSGVCRPCSAYELILTGPALTNDLYNAILSIIEFNQPINARLTTLLYNGINLLVIPYNFTYQTNRVGIHTAFFAKNGNTSIISFDGGITPIFANTAAVNYTNVGTKTVDVFFDNPADVKEIILPNQNLTSFNLSSFTAWKKIDLGRNVLVGPTIGGFAANTENIELLDLSITSVVNLDLSLIQNLGGYINIENNPSLVSFILNPIKTSNLTTFFNLTRNLVPATIDLEPLTFAANSSIIVRSLAAAAITTGTTINNNSIDLIEFRAMSASMLAVSFVNMRGAINTLRLDGNTALTTINAGVAGSFTRAGACDINVSNCPNLGVFLDLGCVPVKTFLCVASGMQIIKHQATATSILNYEVRSCPNLAFYTINNLSGLLGDDNAIVDLSNNSLVDSDVDGFLGELVDVCITQRGETTGGSFTGRVIKIDGSNAAPTALGLGYIAQLTNLNITVFNN